MDGHNIVAVYGSRDTAERARDRLIEIGIPSSDIRMSAASDVAGGTSDLSEGRVPHEHQVGFWDWLFGRDEVPENDRSWYQSNLREGRTALSVFVRDIGQEDRVADVLEEFDPIDFPEAESAGYERRDRSAEPLDTRGEPVARPAMTPLKTANPAMRQAGDRTGLETSAGTGVGLGSRLDRDALGATSAERPASETALGSPEAWSRRDTVTGTDTGTAGAPIGATSTTIPGTPAATTDYRGERAGMETGKEQVIPVVKEELKVGKRAEERRYRIRTYVVETPVERDVTLRDERVIVEHRPVTGEAGLRAEVPQEREFEVVERHEEPVVEKRARNVEEVVVRRDVDERTEKVRDTVRQTRVDVENEAGGRADNLERRDRLERTVPEERKP